MVWEWFFTLATEVLAQKPRKPEGGGEIIRRGRGGDSLPMRQPLGGRRTDTLDYLQSMLGQMRLMAQTEGCDTLSYLIEMAYLEATDIIRGETPSRVRHHEGDRPT